MSSRDLGKWVDAAVPATWLTWQRRSPHRTFSDASGAGGSSEWERSGHATLALRLGPGRNAASAGGACRSVSATAIPSGRTDSDAATSR